MVGISFFAGLCIGTAGHTPSFRPGFPQVGYILPIGSDKYVIDEYLGSGPKKRTFLASKVAKETAIPPSQTYTAPRRIGRTAQLAELPDRVIMKFSSTDIPERVNKLETEYESLAFLNSLQSVRKPLGIYLSRQWKCVEGSDYVCQYLVMTLASPDLSNLVKGNLLKLRAPMLTGVEPPDFDGTMSFEIFLATYALALMTELEKLHAVGLVHSDISLSNVALDPEDYTHVEIIDLGSSRFLLPYASTEKVEQLIKRDFDRVKRIALQATELAIRLRFGSGVDPMHSLLYGSVKSTLSKVELRMSLLRFLDAAHPGVRFDGKVIYAAA